MKKEIFKRISQSGDVVVVVDNETQVEYAFVNNGRGGTAMIPLYNADGTLKTYSELN